ncbi:MAG: nucleotide exchange factor GrpE, partial [candidate division Zixibacteria bacterium]|nr:nucleotide exchange factor GrpE [candidate division Zixibacteria bacterium]
MEESEAKDQEELESKASTSDSNDEVEVEIKSSDVEEDTAGEGDDTEGSDSESSEAVVEPPSVEDQLREKEDQCLRLAAEFDNYKKRTARQFASILESAQAEVITEILTIQDNFERAIQVENDTADFADFKKGVELIFSQLADLLKKNGVESFESVGEKFDPNYHEALMTVESDDKEEGTVVEEFTKGYKFKDRILRHA